MTAGGQVILPSLDGHGPARNSFDPKRLRRALETFRQLPEEVRKPRQEDLPTELRKAGYPTPPAKGLVLKMHGRAFGLDDDGKVYPYPHFGGNPMLDYLWLTEGEVRALLPKDPRKSQSVTLPSWFARRLTWSRMLTEPFEGTGLPAHRRERRPHSLRLTVEDVSDSEVRLRLQGSVPIRFGAWDIQNRRVPQGDYDCDYEFLGHLVHDRKKAAFARLDLVALGAVQPLGSFNYPRPQRGRVMAGLTFELANGTLAESIPPYGLNRQYFSHEE